MLCLLKINNLAIVEDVEIEFSPGLNVLTGETGAGKSIILKALSMLGGARVAADTIRNGAEQCIVEGLFELSPAACKELAAISDQFEDLTEELLIKRVIDRSARGKVYINGQLGTLSLLQQISPVLLSITSQHQQQLLTDESAQLTLLDSFNPDTALAETMAQAYRDWQKAKYSLKSFLSNTEVAKERSVRVHSEYEILAQAELKRGEKESLEQEIKLAGQSEQLHQYLGEALSILQEGEASLISQNRKVRIALEQAQGIDLRLQEASTLAETSAVHLDELQLTLEDYLSRLTQDPENLEALRARVAVLANLERTFGRKGDELVFYFEELKEEIAKDDGNTLSETELGREVDRLAEIRSLAEEKLREKRKKNCAKLSTHVENELAKLNMANARFKVALSPGIPTLRGADTISFLLAANPGEPARAVAKTASGGELSRLLLVLKTLFKEESSPATQVFDEIDAGIGGAVAQVVGEHLQALAQSSQILLITHAPQIAALADVQFLVSKSSDGKRTRTDVLALDEKGRVGQIASMLAGKEVSTQFEESARELLKHRFLSLKPNKVANSA